ncbi:MAG: oligosaccharide flippase family protein [Desulfobacteraceae bacterium]|nr:oligosaccharide flippase family protein [Desulfobacteraceae bacterium]
MGNGSQGKTFLKNTGIVTVSHVGGAVAATIAGILTARYLGPEGKGQVALAMSTGMVLAVILRLGFHEAAPYYIASGRLAPKRVLGCWILTFIIAMVFLYGVVYPLFVCYLMDSVFTGVTKPLLLFGSLVCPLDLLRVLVNSILHGREEFFKRTTHDILIYIAIVIAAVLALVAFHLGSTGYVVTQVALGFGSLIYGFYILTKVIGFHPVFRLLDWFRMLRYGFKAALSQMFMLIDLRLDIYVIN